MKAGQVLFSHITTRGGDEGKTSLINGERRFKFEPIFEVLGTIDELSSALGLVRAYADDPDMHTRIKAVQADLSILAGHVATPPPGLPRSALGADRVEWLEGEESLFLPTIQLNRFILPGDTRLSAHIDVARTVCRRCERVLVHWIHESFAQGHGINQRYLNRLADLLFILGRHVEQAGSSS